MLVQKIKQVILNVVRVFIPTLIILFIVLELFFRFVLPSCERPNTYFDVQNGIVKYDKSSEEGTYSVGLNTSIKGKWRINKQGWNSLIDYTEQTKKKRIAIIGDSFVEGFHVNVEDQFPSLLRKRLKDTVDIISFGRAGAPLSQYLHMARYVSKKYDPDVLIFNVVFNDFHQSLTELSPYCKHFLRLSVRDSIVKESAILPYPSTKTSSVWKKSALVRYLYYNAKLGLVSRTRTTEKKERQGGEKIKQAIFSHLPQIKIATEYVVTTLKREMPNTRLVFVIDAPRPCIYQKGESCEETIQFNFLIEACEDQNIEYINLEKTMRKRFENNGKKFEFPIDQHWNTYGHQVVAESLLKKL